MKNTFQSIGAVLAGIVVIVISSLGTDFLLEKTALFPDRTQGAFTTWMLMLAFGYRTIYGIVGGYVTAALAPSKPIRHAIVLGIIGLLTSGAGAFAAWDLSDHWYPLALVLTALPSAWLGGKLK